VVLSFSLWGLSASALQARDLTPRERSICPNLQACQDIVSRHDASEFDYAVLDIEYRRFGQRGKQALFSLLESEQGHADIAKLISGLGPITPLERQRMLKKWTPEKAEVYLPLLLDGHPLSRDLLLRSLAHPDANIREQVRIALIQLPLVARRAPLSESITPALLGALQNDPISQAASYLNRLNAAGYEREFVDLLGSGDGDIVGAAYTSLYRSNPSNAFNGLLSEMGRIETAFQARAIGAMLASRHKSRTDGFYLQFARKMSGDPDLSVLARASGLHAVLLTAEGPFPDLTPARLAAFSKLIEGQPFTVQDQYLPYLQKVKAQSGLSYIWKVAQSEKWINRDRIASYYSNHPSRDAVISDLIRSNEIGSFSHGLRMAKPIHQKLIREKIDHPVHSIALAARKHLKLPASQARRKTCPVGLFDIEDMRAQMPYFESGWMVAGNKARVSLTREYLTAAHPTATGWLAGYDLTHTNSKSVHPGGTLLHFENSSGAFETIGSFSGPVAILPGQALKLGQTTQQFWVIDLWGPDASDVSAYTLNLSGPKPQINHIGALPKTAKGFAVNAKGDLIIVFEDENQPPIQLSKTALIRSHCSPSSAAIASRAPR